MWYREKVKLFFWDENQISSNIYYDNTTSVKLPTVNISCKIVKFQIIVVLINLKLYQYINLY